MLWRIQNGFSIVKENLKELAKRQLPCLIANVDKRSDDLSTLNTMRPSGQREVKVLILVIALLVASILLARAGGSGPSICSTLRRKKSRDVVSTKVHES